MSTQHKLAQALRLIKDHARGNRVPRWSTDEHVFASREAIANLCDEALAAQQAEREPLEDERREFEVHACEREFDLQRYAAPGDCYINFNTDKHWQTWRAAVDWCLRRATSEREGLTDEHVLQIVQKIDPAHEYLPRALLQLARAIERAHGIGKD